MRKPWNRGGIRTWLLTIGLGLALFLGTTNGYFILAGTALLMLNLIIQFWSKGYLHQDEEVTQSGPYRFVRHPFYLGNILLDSGIVIMSGFWPLMLLAPIWWFAVYIPVMRGEEAHLRSLYGDQYDQYKARVPMLLPLRKPLPHNKGVFEWTGNNIMKTEIPRALRFLTYPLLFALAWQGSQQGTALLLPPDLVTTLLVGSAVALALCSWVWKRHFTHGKSLLPAGFVRLENRVIYLALIVVLGIILEALDPLVDPWQHWIPGMALLALSAAAMGLVVRRPSLAEAALAVALAVLFELHWLALLLVPFYLALILEQRRLAPKPDQGNGWQPLKAPSYAALASLGFTAALITELWIP